MKEQRMLNKDDILKTNAGRKTMTVEVKPWKGQARIRGVSAGEMDHLESLLHAYYKDPLAVTDRVRATACAYFLSDEDGNRMFSNDEIDKLNALPAPGLTVVFNEGMRFNKRAASIEDLEKNSETTPKESSGTK